MEEPADFSDEEEFDDEAACSDMKGVDFKKGDLLVPEGRFGNVTFIITRAAKKVGTLVKMKRAKSSLQVHFSEQSLDDEDEDEDELE